MEQPLWSKVIVNLALQSVIVVPNLPLHKKKKKKGKKHNTKNFKSEKLTFMIYNTLVVDMSSID
jgi:hypothetical protein